MICSSQCTYPYETNHVIAADERVGNSASESFKLTCEIPDNLPSNGIKAYIYYKPLPQGTLIGNVTGSSMMRFSSPSKSGLYVIKSECAVVVVVACLLNFCCWVLLLAV